MLQHQDRAGCGVAGDRVEGAVVQHLQGGGAPGGREGAGALQVAGGQGDQDRDESEENDIDDDDDVMQEIVLGMAKTVFKKRRHWVTLCILLQVLYCTFLYSSVLFCTVLHCIILTVLCCSRSRPTPCTTSASAAADSPTSTPGTDL